MNSRCRTTCAVLAILLVSCGREAEEDETPKPAPAVRNDGIAVVALLPMSSETLVPIGNATVVDVTELVNSASQYAAANAQREQAAAKLRSSSAELQRLRVLNADDHNASDRAVQEAAAAAASDEASLRAADLSALAAESAARQRWGAVIARGLVAGAPWARGLAARETVLLEVAFTEDLAPPAQVRATGAAQRPVLARYLAESPRVDARLQKPVHIYIASSAELPVGLITTIHGPPATRRGVVIPKEAVVWNGDQALVFLEERPGHYAQHPVSTTTPVPGGFLDTSLQAGQRVVRSGAQQLLSDQHKPRPEAD